MQNMLDDKAKRVIRASCHLAKANGLPRVIPECIFDGLLTVEGKASAILRASDISAFLPFNVIDSAELNRIETIPFSKDSRRLLHLSMAAANGLNENRIGTEHLLMGYVKLYEGSKEVPRRKIISENGLSISVPTTGLIIEEEMLMRSLFSGAHAWQPGDMAGTRIGRNDELALVISRLFSHASEAIVLTDRNGIILEANDAYLSLYGYSKGEVIGKTQSIVKSDLVSKEIYDDIWRNILDFNIGHWKGEIINRKKSGENVPILLYITSVQTRLNEISHYLSISMDLTEQNRLLYEREERLSKLAQIGRMTSSIAHDLRTPLTVIKGFSFLANEAQELGKSMNEWTDRISEQCDRLTVMTREITDLASGKITLNLDEVDLNAFIGGFLVSMKDRSYLTGVRFDCALGYSGCISMDKDRMHRVLENLVKNSGLALYKSQVVPKRIWVTTKDDGDHVIIEVNDNGLGVPPKMEQNLFGFGVTSGREISSSGIGLYGALQTVSAHGGEIRYSRTDGISTFTIRMPKKKDAPKNG